MKRSMLSFAGLLVSVLSCFNVSLRCAPAAIYHDPAITHNVYGHNSPLYRRRESLTNFYITKFYECIGRNKGARNECGNKVPAGDRLGRWNMFGVFFGRGASPTDAPFDPNPTTGLGPTPYPALEKAFKILQQVNVGPLAKMTRNYTEPENFVADNNNDGHYSVPINYDKFGIRPGLQFTSRSGFGFGIKSGFCHYKQKPIFNDQTGIQIQRTNESSSSTKGPTPPEDVTAIQCDLMDPSVRIGIANNLDYNNDWGTFSQTAPEDTHIQVHWTHPIKLRDNDKNHVVDVVPYFAVGAWLPTGRSQDQDIAFSLPTGNDGHTGVTFEGAINLNFLEDEVKDRSMLQVGLGGGVTFFDTRDLKDFRVPSHALQSTVFPWKTEIRRRLGTAWNIYCTMKAEFFVSGLTFFADYVFTSKEEDSISICDTDPQRAALFLPKRLEDLSSWCSQNFHLSMNYDITRNLALGAGIQSGITGKKVYRTTTLLCQVTFSF